MSSLNDFRAREEQLRRLDDQLNDKKNEVVRRAEELVVSAHSRGTEGGRGKGEERSKRRKRRQVEQRSPQPSLTPMRPHVFSCCAALALCLSARSQRQQSDRLARLQLESAAPPASTYGAGGQVHHPYGESEQGFLEETTGYRGRYEAPPAAAATAAQPHSRPTSGTAAVRSGLHARPVSAASQEGRRRMSGIPAPQAGASHAAAAAATATAAPARTVSASAARSGLSSASSSRPQSRTAPRFSAAPSAAAPASASASAASASSDPYGDDYAGDGGGGDDAAGGGDVADNVYDDGDALGFGADGTGHGDGGGAVSTAGMGTAATLRFQKARLQALGASVSTLSSTVAARDKELADLKALLKAGNDSREKLLRAKEAAEKQVQALQRQADEAAARGHNAESKAASLERELSQANKRRAELDAEAKARDAKLNRALQEPERGKEMLARAKSGGGAGGAGGGGGEDAAKELSSLRAANKKLLQQRSELLAGFRKQSKLVELLRRQKLHVEMAKMLQFTEEEFAKTLEMGEI